MAEARGRARSPRPRKGFDMPEGYDGLTFSMHADESEWVLRVTDPATGNMISLGSINGKEEAILIVETLGNACLRSLDVEAKWRRLLEFCTDG